MEVILLENIKGLGKLGDIVSVKSGFARNFLVPKNKALLKNDGNIAYFETKKAELEKKELAKNKDLEFLAEKLRDVPLLLKMNASDEGHLYASVTAELIVKAIKDSLNVDVDKHVILVPHGKIRNVGTHSIEFHLSDTISFFKDISVEKDV